MEYRVKYADDGLFPTGHDWVICKASPDTTILFLRTSMCSLPVGERERILSEAWVGFMDARRIVPRQRISA